MTVVDLDSVATRRGRWLGLAVIVAVVASGCATGQATLPPRHTAILVSGQAGTAQHARGNLTGSVCEPVQGPPQAKVTVSIDESAPYAGWGQQLRSETVRRNGSYRFTSVVPGHYTLVGQWPGSPPASTDAWVSAGQTEVVNLPTCIPTTGVDYKPASAAAVSRFVANATAGNNRAFFATYRYLGGEIYGVWPTGEIFSFAQRPDGRNSTDPWGAGNFAYRARKQTHALEFVQRAGHDYECFRSKSGMPWSCEGPNHESIGNALAVMHFDESADLLNHMFPPSNGTSVSSGTLNGLRVTCLRYQESDGSLATWCITANGITAFAASSTVDSVEMLNLSASLPLGVFSLPALPVKWRGYLWWPT